MFSDANNPSIMHQRAARHVPQRYIDEAEAQKWQQIASKLKQAHDLIGEARLLLLMEIDCKTNECIKAIDNAENAVSGLSYLFTPQSEWTGGDSSDPKNFKFRKPHIAR